ncbi:MAG TPA: hypothetical protein VF753_12770 [Terriglobales bacterium]
MECSANEVPSEDRVAHPFSVALAPQISVIKATTMADSYANLTANVSGNLYGTTSEGGTRGQDYGSAGCSTVFKITPENANPLKRR